MHIADLDQGMLGANGIVGGGPPLVVGAALTAKTLKTGNVAVSFTGDGGSNQGTTFEAMNMAVVLQLPAIFVFENNGYGEYTGASDTRSAAATSPAAPPGFGLPAVEGQRRRFLRGARGGARGGRARARRRRPERDRGRYLPVLRPPFGRRAALSRQGRGAAAARGARLPEAFPPARRRGGAARGGGLDAVDGEVAALIDQAVEAARAAPPPDAEALLTDVYVSY